MLKRASYLDCTDAEPGRRHRRQHALLSHGSGLEPAIQVGHQGSFSTCLSRQGTRQEVCCCSCSSISGLRPTALTWVVVLFSLWQKAKDLEITRAVLIVGFFVHLTINPENAYWLCKGKYHCKADPRFDWFGLNQTSYVTISALAKQLNPNKINSKSAVQWYFP